MTSWSVSTPIRCFRRSKILDRVPFPGHNEAIGGAITTLTLNYEWLSLIAGAIDEYISSAFYRLSDDDALTLENQLVELLNDLDD